jgi:hypothetical protein
MECGWCGRLHLCPDSTDFCEYATDDDQDGGRRAYCNEQKEKNPDGVVLNYNCDFVEGKELNGMIFVVGCPCNGLNRFEKFIWKERETIRNYLQHRVLQEYEFAQQELTLNKLAGIGTR